MSKLKLVYYPDPGLREKTGLVTEFNKELHNLIDDMLETMYSAPGIGLAAPQIGSNLRLTVIDISEDQSNPIELINPTIIEKTGQIDSEEGCLSIPGYRDVIKRFEKVKVRAQKRNAEEFEIEGEELLGRALQHEIDHLDGVLFTDYLSPLKKKIFKKWLKKNEPLDE